MTEEIKCRRAGEADAIHVFLLDTIRYEALGKKVALSNNIIVGFYIGIGSNTSILGWISAVTVSENYKVRKIGQDLVSSVCDNLKALAIDAVSLTAEPNLVPYYEKMCFIKVTD